MRQEQAAVSGEPKTHTPEQGPESAAATILRHLQAGPATGMELMDRIHGDETRPKVGEYGWRIITTHLVADTLSAVDALGALMGHQFLTRDERGAVALTLPEGVPVVARDEAAELRAAAIEWWQAMRDYRYVPTADQEAQNQRLLAAENRLAGAVKDLAASEEES